MRPLILAAAGVATLAVSVPATAQGQTAAPAPQADVTTEQADVTTEPAQVRVTARRLDVLAGAKAQVAGRVTPGAAGQSVVLERKAGRRWTSLDRDRTDDAGRFELAVRMSTPGSAAVRVRAPGVTRSLGRLDVYRRTFASYYGPGLYGGPLACGGRLSPGTLGVAHKTLPCGTRVTFKHGRREVTVPVIDRGPYVGGRTWDLTAATKRKLGFGSTGQVLSTR